jgi:hypothetical protein
MKKVVQYLPYAVLTVLLGIATMFAVQIVQIQLRLSRNGAIGRELVESLQVRFPVAKFRSAASYEREAIYITVIDGIDDANKPEVERRLRAEKNERKLPQEIWLDFLPNDDPKRIKI